MVCPQCRAEFVPGIARCPDCEVALVAEAPAREPIPWATVLETGDPALLAAAQSLLMEAEVPFRLRNEQLQELFAWGRLGTGFNPVVGPVILDVPEERQAEARELLAELEEYPGLDEDQLPSG